MIHFLQLLLILCFTFMVTPVMSFNYKAFSFFVIVKFIYPKLLKNQVIAGASDFLFSTQQCTPDLALPRIKNLIDLLS